MASKKFQNRKQLSFLDSIPQVFISSDENKLTLKCKFNFAYFDNSQEAGQKFSDWSHNELTKLLDKLKEYSKESLEYWSKVEIGQAKPRSHILEIYGKFPTEKSDFIRPSFVPDDIEWARFRLESSVRLIGFIIPEKFHDTIHQKTEERFDKNTFYIVFLDKNHLFYKTKQ
jgi:hypothetical protein